jgi:hypothetical protein
MIEHKIVKRPGDNGGEVEGILRVDADKTEEIGTISDLYTLFDECDRRWPAQPKGNGWDFNKILTAIREADFN